MNKGGYLNISVADNAILLGTVMKCLVLFQYN
jgi:hypothetical protein